MRRHGLVRAIGARWPRRSSPLASFAVVACCASLLAACSSSGTGTSAGSSPPTGASAHTLQLAFTEDTQPLDPDVYYAGQGLVATTAMYEGLVEYAPQSLSYTGNLGYQAVTSKPSIVPDLATSWSVSPDGLTYTFNLRQGVKFHDGTPFTSAAVKADIARREAVNGGPAYQEAMVTAVDTPSPYVAVVHLSKPTNAFMDYLASAYGLKMISPTLLAAHTGKDQDQSYLQVHDGGTGPYTMTKAQPGQDYQLSYYPGYWGTKPYYTTVDIRIIPNISTQEIEFEDGQLSLLLQGLNTQAIQQFRSTSADRVYEVPTLETPALWVNPHTPVFSSEPARQDLNKAIDRKALVDDVYPGRAVVADQIYPSGEVPAGTAGDDQGYDPGSLEQFLKGYNGSKAIILGYDTADPADEPLADLLQTELASDGLQVTVKGYTDTVLYGFPGNLTGAPDLIIDSNWPDAAGADTWARIVMYSTGTMGGLNYFQCSVPGGDSLLDQANSTLGAAQALTLDEQAGDAYAASGCWDTIAYRGDSVVAPKWMSGIAHQVPVPETVILADLHPQS
jgi:peptide/nickel transport system substrate-binding protein